MASPDRYLDMDPPPRRSPRLFAEMGDVPGSVAPASLRPAKLTPSQRARLRRDLAIFAAVEMGMSFRMAAGTFKCSYSGIRKSYNRTLCRKNRV